MARLLLPTAKDDIEWRHGVNRASRDVSVCITSPGATAIVLQLRLMCSRSTSCQ